MENLRYGDRGLFVLYLQYALGRAGFSVGELDGIFGRRTLTAVQNFQRSVGLSADGVVGRLTRAALYPYLAGYTLYTVVRGDSVYKIAQSYSTSVEAILTANPNIEPTNLQIGATITVPLGFPAVITELPYSYLLTQIVVDGLLARYPFIRRESIGASVIGRELVALTIGSGARHLSFNAAHHANEWITTPTVLLFLEDYAKAWAEGGELNGVSARELYEGTTLYLVPLVNPDGVDLVNGALPMDDVYYRQAKLLSEYYPSIPFPRGWKANISGTDLNLGYPAAWEEARRVKFAQGFTRPGPRDYVGSAPLAAPEDAAMYNFTLEHDFVLVIAYHTQGEVIYWQFLDYNPPGAFELGQAFAQASGYALEDEPYASSFAGYKDWFIQNYNRPGYTVEAGRGQNPLPISDLASIYRDNKALMTTAVAYAASRGLE